jgi:hypothetical protein
MNPNLYHLSLLTDCVLDRARQKVREGKKDEARDWYRFIFQTNILGVLHAGGYDVALLHDKLKLLGDECHPSDHVQLKGELERIAAALEVLSVHILEKDFPNSAKCAPKLGQSAHNTPLTCDGAWRN